MKTVSLVKKCYTIRPVLVSAFGLLLTNIASAQWKAGLASADVTPGRAVLMSGYGGRPDPHKSVNSRIFAKALVIEDQNGHRGVIITADLVSIGGKMATAVCERISAQTGLKREQILLNISHTHAGPEIWIEDVPVGDSEALQSTRAYIQTLEDKLVEVAVHAASETVDAGLSHGVGFAPFVMNRREQTGKGVRIGFNPRGYADRSVPVFRIADDDGKVIGVLFGVACHPTTSGGKNYAIDGDYPGHAQSYIQQRYPDAVAMFVAGCGGDANPYPRGTLELAAEHGRVLGEEVCRLVDGKLAPLSASLKTELEYPRLFFVPQPPKEKLEILAVDKSQPDWYRWSAKKALGMREKGQAIPNHYDAPLAMWQFGGDFTFVALPGEPVADFVPAIAKAIGPLNLWVAGYCNEVIGYLPSDKDLEEGGYETRGVDTGPLVGQFAPGTEKIIVDSVSTLAKRVGRE